MARPRAIIKKQIMDQIAIDPVLSTLNSPSQVAFFSLYAGIVAIAINLLEQLQDILTVDLNSLIGKSAVGSEAWLQNMVLLFQYSATVPQILTLINFVPGYAVIDPTLRIISRCSVKTTGSKIVQVKVATGSPATALSGPQLTALSGYLSLIDFAGVVYNAVSYNSDKFYLKATIIYNGQYQSVIQATVIAAIENYFENIPFDGDLRILTLIDYIQAVPGVSDVFISDAAVRADTVPFGSKTYLIQNKTQFYTSFGAFSGYAEGETTTGNTLADTLTFTVR